MKKIPIAPVDMLPCKQKVVDFIFARKRDEAAFATAEAVNETVRKQVDAGIDKACAERSSKTSADT